ncbi:helix-turn-helix domain-containing protein [Micromonospora marina]|uniref:helix-turn-helix domain-containing protein n=1 Tax=Micromonospora marina TaxID=307120 RepID=UPI00345126A1
MTGDSVPIGRRVAYLRARRNLSQQAFADRLGRSKSWVDKVERGVRSLERVSTIREVAAVLRVDTAALLGHDVLPAGLADRSAGIARIRAALSTYGTMLGQPTACQHAPPELLRRMVEHAWITFQHARYPQLITQLPALLTEAQRTDARDPNADLASVVEAYRLTAAMLVKLDEASLAWLAADRAMSAGTGDPLLSACAAVQLGPILRVSARAKSVMLTAAYRVVPADLDNATPQELSLCGSLLVQAALASARAGHHRAVDDLLAEATEMAGRVGDGRDHHHTGFGPTAVDLARVSAAVELGDGRQAVTRHEMVIEREGWPWLPLERRAAHLVDVAHAHLQIGDVTGAGRALMQVGVLAPAEIRLRPGVRRLLVAVARHPDAPAAVIDFTTGIGL